jgi:hypothetical protein
MPYC